MAILKSHFRLDTKIAQSSMQFGFHFQPKVQNLDQKIHYALLRRTYESELMANESLVMNLYVNSNFAFRTLIEMRFWQKKIAMIPSS